MTAAIAILPDLDPTCTACAECGQDCVVEPDGTTFHLLPDGSVDHDSDADHTAIDESLYGALA